MPRTDQRQHAQVILRHSLAAVAPDNAVLRQLHTYGTEIHCSDFRWQAKPHSRVLLLGGGKAAAPMAQAAEAVLYAFHPTGILVTKYGHSLPLDQVKLCEAAHPLPDRAGEVGARAVIQLAEEAGEDDLVICLLSGGASALLPAPVAGVSLADKLRATELLMKAGADIFELNTLRRHLSRIKGGGLARSVAPASLLTLAVSDVIGDPPDVIGSGPTVADPSSFADALEIISRYQLKHQLPESVLKYLRRGLEHPELETCRADDLPAAHHYQVIASLEQAVTAAAEHAEQLGYTVEVLTTSLQGEARQAATELVTTAIERQRRLYRGGQPLCLIAGGETTVTITGEGLGGRNQELALAAALALEGRKGITLLAAGTDGTDGPTDAAGAVVDGGSVDRGRQLGLAASAFLAANDSYHYFAATDELLITGPTRTNVMDLNLVLIEPPRS